MSVSLITAGILSARLVNLQTQTLSLNGLSFPSNTPTNGEVLTYNATNNDIEWAPSGGGGGGSIVYATLSTPIEFIFLNGITQSNPVGTSNLYLSRVGDNVSCRLDLTTIQTFQNPSSDKCDSLLGVAIINENFSLPNASDLLIADKVNLLYTTNGTDFTKCNYGSMFLSSVDNTLQIRICNDNYIDTDTNTFNSGCFVSLGASNITNETESIIVYPSNLLFSYSVN